MNKISESRRRKLELQIGPCDAKGRINNVTFNGLRGKTRRYPVLSLYRKSTIESCEIAVIMICSVVSV